LSTARQLTAAALLLSASTIASRLLGFARDAVIAFELGAGAATDAYHAAFFIPDVLNYLLAGGALSITFIPLFSRHLAAGEADRGWLLFSRVVSILGMALLAATALAWVAAPTLIALWYDAFSPEQVALTTQLTRIVLLGPLFFLVGGLLNATEMARKRFAAAAIAPLVYNACIIAGGLLFGPRLGVAAFSWGAMVGVVLGPFLIPLLYARAEARLTLSFDVHDPDVRRFFYLALPLMLGITLIFFDQRLCERYARGEGVITWLNNARRLLLVPVGVIGQAIGQAALPYLASLHAERKRDTFEQTLGDALRGTATLALVAATALAVASGPIVTLVYGRGAYTAFDVAQTATLLTILSVGLVGWAVQTVALRGFYAREVMWPPMVLGTLMVIGTVPLYAGLEQWRGASGLAIASSLAVTLNLLSILALYHRRFGQGLWAPLALGLRDGALAAVPAGLLTVAALFGSERMFGTLGAGWMFGIATLVFGPVAVGVLVRTTGPAAQAVRRRLQRLSARRKE
jgi:putative peptidoglycan lipid II flippase